MRLFADYSLPSTHGTMSLYAAAVYVSSSSSSTIAALAARARMPGVALVDTFIDEAYARSSLKLVGAAAPLVEAVRATALAALSAIDLREQPHPAPHPRAGALDMIAFMPLSSAAGSSLRPALDACESAAEEAGRAVGESGGVPVVLYGARRGPPRLSARDALCAHPSHPPP